MYHKQGHTNDVQFSTHRGCLVTTYHLFYFYRKNRMVKRLANRLR